MKIRENGFTNQPAMNQGCLLLNCVRFDLKTQDWLKQLRAQFDFDIEQQRKEFREELINIVCSEIPHFIDRILEILQNKGGDSENED